MGDVTAATMLAEMGEDRGRFPTADVLLAETGTAPVTRSSGRSHTVRFRYAANKHMRHAIDWWAFVSVRENAWARDAYEQARARGQLHNRALRGIGARWTRILWRCWIDSKTYDPSRHMKSSPTATTA
jgi:transposase